MNIKWVQRDLVAPNEYNPNQMTWTERRLLLRSILEDGWTQPVVVVPSWVEEGRDAQATWQENEDGYLIVDGEQRWTVADMPLLPEEVEEMADEFRQRGDSDAVVERLTDAAGRLRQAMDEGQPAKLVTITAGLVPVNVIDSYDRAHRLIATIRHNRARGLHAVEGMADLTATLVELELPAVELQKRLAMQPDEVSRLVRLTTKHKHGEVHADAALPADVLQSERARDADQAAAITSESWRLVGVDRASVLLEVDGAVRQHADEVFSTTGQAMTQQEKDQYRHELLVQEGLPAYPAPIAMRKVAVTVTGEEQHQVETLLGLYQARRMMELVALSEERVDQVRVWMREVLEGSGEPTATAD